MENPLIPSSDEHIKSWEAWRAAVKAVLTPSKESLLELQRSYDLAKHQFKTATSRE